ncbi:hypothetical protein [Streptomyces sp. NBC_01789]|uniref:hypothetical protein n=1 Tax=Streptomyces sp. NBC_01789 TaxID=2975941 RepID=UPI00225B7810|nr:hypothetical protein [Streptomyces sp. NBC_01789]MCX4450645.1 hypothetical protein [Streptomyces sp. NBC_01789]
MPDTTPTTGPLGPITPIRCTEPGCHWSVHGVPDKYADSRARIVREHLAVEHVRQVLGTPTAPECRECGDTGACNGGPCPLGTPTTDPAPAEVCICGHTEAQHFEDCCQVCDCGDFLVPEAARESIAHLRNAVIQLKAQPAPAAPALEPQGHPGADLFVALQAAGLDDDEAHRRMYAYAGMILREERATADAPAAPADRGRRDLPYYMDRDRINAELDAADRRDRYAAAILDALARDTTRGPHWGAAADAVMAVADAEQAALRAEVEGLDEALRGLISASDKDCARLRAEVNRLRADRATVLREAAATLAAHPGPHRDELQPDAPGFWWDTRDRDAAAALLRRLADEAQPTETETQPTDGTERPEETARRFARRLRAIERLCGGRPGYHTITVKALLTAMSDADDEPATAATEEPQP